MYTFKRFKVKWYNRSLKLWGHWRVHRRFPFVYKLKVYPVVFGKNYLSTAVYIPTEYLELKDLSIRDEGRYDDS